MFAVIEVAGKQYRVEKGDRLDLDLAEGVEPQPRVLLLSKNGTSVTDPAALAKATVTLKVQGRVTERLERAMKFKRRQGASSKRTFGHRNVRTRVTVDAISG